MHELVFHFLAGAMGAFVETAGQRATSIGHEEVHHQARAALCEDHDDRQRPSIRNGSVLERAEHPCRFERNA